MRESESQRAIDLGDAWEALARAPESVAAKRQVVAILKRHPELLDPRRRTSFLHLIRDLEIEPIALARAGWTLLGREGLFELSGNFERMAERVEGDPLALALLEESYVNLLDAEIVLTLLRRWMLLTGTWRSFPRTAAALIQQAAQNCGAWPFDEQELERLQGVSDEFATAYLPQRTHLASETRYSDDVTGRVADQYRAWPYPLWTRVTTPARTTIPATMASVDPGGPPLPTDCDLLVAGCGTGREVAILAGRYPDARITAIDISESSLAYGVSRVPGVDFRLLDLHRVADLGRNFDVIVTSGVLHHLPSPEKGWEALVSVLKPAGIMKVMLYSRMGRMKVTAARMRIADLLDKALDDTLLRNARRWLIERPPVLVAAWNDFYTLPGVHDLLLNRHEDPFDVGRIGRAIADLRLDFLGFVLPGEDRRERYRRDHPHDPLFRDLKAWAALEKGEPSLFSGMYEFWCRKRR